jgi:hypothetical protein
MANKAYFVTGNEQRSLAGVFLENLLCQRRLDNGFPLFIESGNGFLPNGAARKKMKERALRAFDWLPGLDIALLPMERAKDLAADGRKAETRLAEERFTDAFLYDDVNRDTLPLLGLCDYLIVLLKSDVYAAGFIYKLLKLLNEGHLPLKTLVVLSGVPYIEEAALSFKRYRDELQGMLGERPDVQFGGFFPIDAGYLAHAAQVNLPCVKVFPDTAFQGAIKYVNRSLDGLENHIRDLPFLYALGKLKKNAPPA